MWARGVQYEEWPGRQALLGRTETGVEGRNEGCKGLGDRLSEEAANWMSGGRGKEESSVGGADKRCERLGGRLSEEADNGRPQGTGKEEDGIEGHRAELRLHPSAAARRVGAPEVPSGLREG